MCNICNGEKKIFVDIYKKDVLETLPHAVHGYFQGTLFQDYEITFQGMENSTKVFKDVIVIESKTKEYSIRKGLEDNNAPTSWMIKTLYSYVKRCQCLQSDIENFERGKK